MKTYEHILLPCAACIIACEKVVLWLAVLKCPEGSVSIALCRLVSSAS